MVSLLTALLLMGPPSARALDDPAAQAASLDPADADGDGTVTGKERRQKRRAERRARRGERGPNGELKTDAEMDAEEKAEASARGSSAAGKAAAAAAALKSSLPSASDAGGGPPDSGGARSEKSGSSGGRGGGSSAPLVGDGRTAASAFTAGATGDPGRPRAPSDFALAARSGYAPAFAAAGLQVGPDGRSLMRLDGRPASAEDYARLQREIGAMPAALGRRPDFFSIVSPEHYADLKRGYKEKKDGDPVYKDVGTTEGDRDFVHTASCDKLSGDCNKSAEKGSYKKGDFVAPEDLDHMWDALQKELDAAVEQAGGGGLLGVGAAHAQLARDKAIEAAVALGGGGPGGGKSASGGEAGVVGGASSPAGPAGVATRLWKRASELALPGGGGGPSSGSGTSLLLLGAAAGVLGAGVLLLRRKG